MYLTGSNAGKICLTLFLAFSFTLAFSQTKSRLEKQKKESIRKIKETEKIIKETKSQKNATMGQLTAISKQIEARQELINSISQEIRLLDQEINEKTSLVEALENDLEILQKEYAALIYAASKTDQSKYKLAFIFSAGSVNQMVMRIKYFQQYSDAREQQLEQIQKVKETVYEAKTVLYKKRREKNYLLENHTAETNDLSNLKKEKDHVVKELSQKETELKKELEATKKSLKNLENKIRQIIEEERKKALAAAEEAKRKAAADKAKKPAPAASESVSGFAGNQKKLPWPVTNGTVVKKYGVQKHPVLGIEENNLGVAIQTLKGAQVKAVYSGKVISITEIPGMNKIVMIQHGEYFTVYARLKKVFVQKDQMVSAKELIGEVYTSKDEVSQVEFQIWKGNSHLDPEQWLTKK